MGFFKKAFNKLGRALSPFLSDKAFINMTFKRKFGHKPDLEHPKTLCEKIEWLKLNDRKPIYTDYVDKVKVKDIAKSKGLEVIPLIGVYNKFDDIDFDKLPNQFIIKTNHTSGGFVVCKDKVTFDIKKARKIINKSLRMNYFKFGREWPYKNVERKILIEPFVDSLGKPESIEYKVTCFNGKVEFVTICRGIAHSDYCLRKNDFYDLDFNLLPFVTEYYENSGVENKKPVFWDEMIRQSELLAEGTYYLRVDFYDINGKLTFGEATFFTWSGLMKFNPPEYDRILGDKLKLPTDETK